MLQHHEKRYNVIAPRTASLQLLFDSVGIKFHTQCALGEFDRWLPGSSPVASKPSSPAQATIEPLPAPTSSHFLRDPRKKSIAKRTLGS
jgi:hypothetical protein